VPRQVIINATPQEVRVAVMENARLVELFLERRHEQGLAGSIYKGRVTRVLPGIQAAFVDIGLPKAAFLHASDFYTPTDDDESVLVEPRPASPPTPTEATANDAPQPPASPSPMAIEDRLKKGDEILVQIVKEPIGSKGARVSSNIAIPGRYVVYLPLTNHVGISRRIESAEERERLLQAVDAARPRSGGIIVRTASERIAKREIQGDIRFLRKLWDRVHQKAEGVVPPSLLHYDLDLVLRTLRDSFDTDVSKVIIDNRRDYVRAIEFVDMVLPAQRRRIELYNRKEPIFERYGIEAQINRALDRNVWLKSGGYIVIDHTEALTAIDVNTGRFVGKNSQEETALQTNLEAARAIVDQLRLRHIGGLIVIDFIDMEKTEHRKQVLAALNEAVRGDKVRTNILGLSDLGLVQMTRQRTRENLMHRLCEPCPTCSAKGWVKSSPTIFAEIMRRVRREATMNAPLERVAVTVHPQLAAFVKRQESASVRELQESLGVEIFFHQASHLAPDQYEVTAVAKPAQARSTEGQQTG
jgi:ribonuclease G